MVCFGISRMTEAHRRQKQPQLIRGQLLAVVRSLLVEQGPHAVTLDAVAKQANVTKGGLQHHFRTKQQDQLNTPTMTVMQTVNGILVLWVY